MNNDQTMDSRLAIGEQDPAAAPIPLESAVPLHRLGDARRQERVSRRKVAQRLGITEQQVIWQECKTTDLPLSVLRKWAKVLGLPVAELLEEPKDSLSTPLANRARLTRVMKTAMSILERSRSRQTKRMAQNMVDQLIEIMPELRGASAWNAVGKRRGLDELGIAAERRMSDETYRDMDVVDCEHRPEPQSNDK